MNFDIIQFFNSDWALNSESYFFIKYAHAYIQSR